MSRSIRCRKSRTRLLLHHVPHVPRLRAVRPAPLPTDGRAVLLRRRPGAVRLRRAALLVLRRAPDRRRRRPLRRADVLLPARAALPLVRAAAADAVRVERRRLLVRRQLRSGLLRGPPALRRRQRRLRAGRLHAAGDRRGGRAARVPRRILAGGGPGWRARAGLARIPWRVSGPCVARAGRVQVGAARDRVPGGRPRTARVVMRERHGFRHREWERGTTGWHGGRPARARRPARRLARRPPPGTRAGRAPAAGTQPPGRRRTADLPRTAAGCAAPAAGARTRRRRPAPAAAAHGNQFHR